MFQGFKIVCVTPAGRRRYMRLLAPQILASPLVDRYDIWVNTTNPADLEFFRVLADRDPRVRLVAQPDGKVEESYSIGAFHREAIDADTVYIRFDDDVVWIQPDFFEKHLAFRIANPDYLLTMPLIVNNAVCTALMERSDKIKLSRDITIDAFDKVTWRDGQFAHALHELFLGLVERKEWSRLWGKPCVIAFNRFSINCISWFGRDLAPHLDMITREEEHDWTVASSYRLGKANCFATDTVVAHYAFYAQRAYLDPTDLLDRYERALGQRPDVGDSLRSLAGAVAEIDARYAAKGGDGGVTPRQPGWRERIKVWSRKYRGREARVWLHQT